MLQKPVQEEEHVEEGVTVTLPVGLAATCASHVREANQPAINVGDKIQKHHTKVSIISSWKHSWKVQ